MYHFETPTEFTRWKDGMEEEDHVYYTKEKEYKPLEGMMHVPQIQSQQCVHTGDVTKRVYYVCCRDGNYRSCTKQNQTGKKHPHQKDTRKLNNICISRIYVDYYIDGHVTVTHITAYTNHQPGHHEDKYLPLPKSVKDEIAIKLSNGIPAERIMEGTHCSPYSIYS